MRFEIIIMAALVVLVHAQSNCVDGPSTSLTLTLSVRVRACSRKLSCAIAFLCNNKFKIIKRDTSFIEKLQSDDLYDFTAKKNLVTAVRSRVRRQNITDCCHDSCTLLDLITEYCPEDSTIFEQFPKEENT